MRYSCTCRVYMYSGLMCLLIVILISSLVLNDQIEKKEGEIADVRRNIKKLEEYRVQYDE